MELRLQHDVEHNLQQLDDHGHLHEHDNDYHHLDDDHHQRQHLDDDEHEHHVDGLSLPHADDGDLTGAASATSSTSKFVHPQAAGPLTATVNWNPLTTVDLIVYSSSLTVVGQTSGSSGSLSLALTLPLDSSYKVKVKNTGSQPITFMLSVTHC